MRLPLSLAVAGPAARAELPALAAAAGLVVLRVGAVLLRPWPLALAVDHALRPAAQSTALTVSPAAGPTAASTAVPATAPATAVSAGGHGWVADPLVVLALAAAASVLLSAIVGLLDMAVLRSVEGAAERIGAGLRATMFQRTMTRSLRWHDRMRSGELVSRLTTDVGRLLDAVVAVTTSFLPDAVMLAGVIALLVAFDPQLALIGLTVAPVLAALAVRQRRLIRAAQQDARTESGRLAGATTDLLRNVRAVQAFGRFDRAAAIFGTRNRAVLDVELRAIEVDARWTPMADVVLAIGAALVLVVGGRHVLTGALSVGGLLVVLAYLRDLYSPVRGLTRLSVVLAKAGASAVRVRDVLACDEAVQDRTDARPAPHLRTGIRFERVSFGYEPGRPVLDHFDLDIAAGETVCLLGPSGIGKSTALHLLLRLYDVDAGRILIDGVDLRDCDQRSLRDRFAFVPQDPWLLDATVAENIAFGNENATRAGVVAAGRAALVDEFADRLPFGYDTPLGEGGVRLSGGQRRRVALARAAVSSAPMVLLDEPTASLDPVSAAAVIEAIRTTTAQRTVLVVTHDRDLAAIADRVVTLDHALSGRR
ncbi:ABC transporter ATP-binding protein [Kribbella sp. NPDC004875]|uniref:ABC transporter ATP-binding protein n=1 Tax=Kribbella sp. NPDC004875 TaxID=3364107 RepID=UPI0036A53DA3